jgi:nitroimidazol reductase NimA-like FMN-containing flavoprotein (pyridoxamine 5'-phosphate oxidase superfamily)
LAAENIGRLAIVAGGIPQIFPVNYVLDGEMIVIRSDPGTKLDSGPGTLACFEIDFFERDRRRGWSVVAGGRLEEVTRYDAEALAQAKALPVDPWAGGEKAHWLRLVATQVTGRRVGDYGQ